MSRRDSQRQRWARTRAIVLHEVAHALAQSDPAHGWRFAQVLLALVQHFMGVAVATALRRHFRTYRVRYAPPRQLSPAARARLREHARRVLVQRKKVQSVTV